MKKTIIAIQGIGNKGKTETVKRFREVLLEAYPNSEEEIKESDGDIKTIITINYNGKPVKIGIESQGDPNSRLTREGLKWFLAEKCDIIICACRTYGETVDTIDMVSKNNGYDVIYNSPYKSGKDHEALNHLKAKHLLSLLKEYILI